MAYIIDKWECVYSWYASCSTIKSYKANSINSGLNDNIIWTNAKNADASTYLIRVSTDNIQSSSSGTAITTGFYDYDIIDSTNGDATGCEVTYDSFGNAIVTTADDTTYYYNDSYVTVPSRQA